MAQLSKKLIRLKSKEGMILYPELGDKTVTREKLVEGNAIPIIVTVEEASNDYIRKYNEYYNEERGFSDVSEYISIKEITSSNVDDYIDRFQNGTPIFINIVNQLLPINIFNSTDIVCTYPPYISYNGIPTVNYLIGHIIDGKFILKCVCMYFHTTINRLTYQSIVFESSGITTVTVPPNRRVYYYASDAESSGKPEYSMGVHGNITFNLDLPEDYEDSDTVSYHIELWEFMSDKRIKFPENINFQITPISTFDGTMAESEDSVIQPMVNIDSNGTTITVEDTSNGGNSNNRNYHMIIDICFDGKYYLGTIKVIPMIEGSLVIKYSKIKFVFDNDEGSYSDIVPSSGTIGDNGLVYTNTKGEFTYTYKGTSYTPGITIDQYNPINKVIRIQN